jgi:DNA-binding MarR family transcriptional regulator
MAMEGITVAEWAMLGELKSTKTTTVPSRLAVNLGLTPCAISKLSDRLTDKGLIVRQENPTDGRTYTLALTSEGERLVPRLAEIADRHDAEVFGHWSKEGREMFVGFLAFSVRGPLRKNPEA